MINYDDTISNQILSRHFFINSNVLKGIRLNNLDNITLMFDLLINTMTEFSLLNNKKAIIDLMYLLLNQRETDIFLPIFFRILKCLLSFLRVKVDNNTNELLFPSKELLKISFELYSTFYITYERYIFTSNENNDKLITFIYIELLKCFIQPYYNPFILFNKHFIMEETLFNHLIDIETIELYRAYSKVLHSIIEKVHNYVKLGRKHQKEMISTLLNYINSSSVYKQELRKFKKSNEYKIGKKLAKYNIKADCFYLKKKCVLEYYSILNIFSLNTFIDDTFFNSFCLYCRYPKLFPDDNNITFKFILYLLTKANKVSSLQLYLKESFTNHFKSIGNSSDINNNVNYLVLSHLLYKNKLGLLMNFIIPDLSKNNTYIKDLFFKTIPVLRIMLKTEMNQNNTFLLHKYQINTHIVNMEFKKIEDNQKVKNLLEKVSIKEEQKIEEMNGILYILNSLYNLLIQSNSHFSQEQQISTLLLAFDLLIEFIDLTKEEGIKIYYKYVEYLFFYLKKHINQ